MTDLEKELMEVFGRLIPLLDEQDLHDLIVSGRALTLLKTNQKQNNEQKAG